MANTITGKVWSLDTVTGLVTTGPVNIHAIHVRFTTAAAGSCIITSNSVDGGTVDTLVNLNTVCTSTADAYVFDFYRTLGDQTFQGLKKTLCVNVDTIYVVTSPGR